MYPNGPDYRIIHASTQAELEAQVKELVKQGWYPIGGAQVTVVQFGANAPRGEPDDIIVVQSFTAQDLTWTQTLGYVPPELPSVFQNGKWHDPGDPDYPYSKEKKA